MDEQLKRFILNIHKLGVSYSHLAEIVCFYQDYYIEYRFKRLTPLHEMGMIILNDAIQYDTKN